MQTAILTLHVIVCLILVVLVLLQSGREGMGVIFGGGGNSSVFGSAGAGGVLAKLTTFLAVIFICTSLGYNIMTSSTRTSQESVLDVQFEEVPAAPAQVPAAAPAPAAPAASEAAAPAPAAEPAAPAAAEPEQAAAAPEAAAPAADAAPAE
ncbi:preprotein translocase subunit SecG [Mailhella massiliensis]|uniref:preprotein translocase subunit SecG n=1 Tax=Mailhella massiliensis TaxID=1903261 RepID=UPI00097D156F|nr:preprotein translocase subunit SecG [Mailhella massiliensis]